MRSQIVSVGNSPSDSLSGTSRAVRRENCTNNARQAPQEPIFELVAPSELSPQDIDAWERLRTLSEDYRSPYFSYRFTAAVAKCIEDCFVAVARRGGEVVAVLPVQTDNRRQARPPGLGINDAHGILKAPSLELSALELCQNVGLQSYAFHASPVNLPDSQRFSIGRTRSFLADSELCQDGYEAYLRANSTTVDRQDQKTRRLIRQAGPLRFEFDCQEQCLLDKLITWKRQQYQRTHTFDILGQEWIRQLLHVLHQLDRRDMHGILSVLFAGETPVAMHYGLLERDFLHYWYPVFSPEFGYGSPGTQLFLEIVRECGRRSIPKIDFGYGEQDYKYKLTNVKSEMAFGLADASATRRTANRIKTGLRSAAKKAPGKAQLKPLLRKVLPNFGGSHYES